MNATTAITHDDPRIDGPANEPEPAEIGWSEFREEHPDRAEQIDADWAEDNLEALDALVEADMLIRQQHDRPGVLNRAQLEAVARIRAATTSLLKFRELEMERIAMRRRNVDQAIDRFTAAIKKPEVPTPTPAPQTTTERIIAHNANVLNMVNEAMGLPPGFVDNDHDGHG